MRCRTLLLTAAVVVGSSGCATYWDHESLQQRVTTLEGRVKKLEEERKTVEKDDAERRQKLENCVTLEADEEYWNYVRLNGKKIGEGKYSASQYIWDQARLHKMDKIEECKLLYARQ
jgi:hypothetical protein